MKYPGIRVFWVFWGGFFLIVGVVGVFVPLLPTTPFLILAALCFNRGSPRFHSWILNHKIFGPPIRDWNARHAIQLKYKILATTMMAVSLGFLVSSERIPAFGKYSVTAFLTALALFIWTRRS